MRCARHGPPGAGYLATAEDLARFGAALLRPGMLSERGRAELFRPVPLADRTATEFALGFRAKDDGRRLLHQPGIPTTTWWWRCCRTSRPGRSAAPHAGAITDGFFAAMSE